MTKAKKKKNKGAKKASRKDSSAGNAGNKSAGANAPADDETVEARDVRESWDIDAATVTSITAVDGGLYAVATPGQTYHLQAAEVEALGLKVPAPGEVLSGAVPASAAAVVPFDEQRPDDDERRPNEVRERAEGEQDSAAPVTAVNGDEGGGLPSGRPIE
jgi:hypothetical protein